ncbi:MAG TPA: pitrilysin family protein [Isosphaeraceae bacterium]|nr:pitrilysin family protein [Isosphaeraceae bacterium]
MSVPFRIPGSGRLGVAVLGLLIVAAGARAAAPKKITTVEGITEYRLDNGLRVLLFPDQTRPKVTVNLTVLVGSRHEGYGETGMAHLLEHMLFKGTPSNPDIPGAMKERGAQFNGSTWLDRTNYFETLPATDQNLEFAIRLEADRMTNSPIKAEDLATEFSVVRNEFEAGENSPERILSQRMMAVAYEWHNYGKSTIGNRSDIERVPADRLRDFYKKYYQPDNAVLVVAGKFDENKALDYISRYFGALPRPARKLQETYTEEPAQDGERVVTLRRVGDVGLVGLLYHVPAGPHAEFPAVEVLADILGDEPSGRLYKALVETRMAADVSVNAQPYHDPGVLEINAEVNTKDRATLEKVRDRILSVIEEVVRTGVTKEEVNRARQSILKEYELDAHDPNRIAIELSEWAAQGDWRLYFLNRDRSEQVTPAQVQEVAAKYLKTSNLTVGFFVPTTKSERTPIPEVPDIAKLVGGYTGRQTKETTRETFAISPMAIEAQIQRPEPIAGVKLALLPRKTRGEAVQLRLTLRYGNAENLKGFNEASGILPELMTRGTQSMTREQIKDALDKNLARLGTGMGGRMIRAFTGGLGIGSVTFTVETKRAKLPAVLEILRQILREPTLPGGEFEVLKNEEIAGIEQGLSDPMRQGLNRVLRLFSRQYPSDDVRYVPTLSERLERTRKLSLDQVRALYHGYLGADHGELVMIGDFEPSEVLPILGKTFEGWKAEKPYARIERPLPPDLKPERDTIQTPDKANAIYVAGLQMPLKDSDPDYPALLAGNYILGGGGLSSRLADRLRQKGGLSYTAMSMLSADPFDAHAMLMILAIYNPSNVDKVATGVDEEVHRLLRDGVKPDELERAKKGYLQQQQVLRTNDTMLAVLLTEDLYVGRTLRFQADLEEKIQALTPAAVDAALRKHINPKQLSVVTAGDFPKTK